MSESFADVLSELGFSEGFISINHQARKADGTKDHFNSAVVEVSDAPRQVAEVEGTSDVWFGINPVAGPERTLEGRGKASDVTRLLVLPIDLDVKPEGVESLDVAEAIISDLSEMLNCPPVAVTSSGHGLQPLWALEDGEIGEEFTHGHARALLRRWGRLVASVAERRGGNVDSIFDLPRVLRVPGTTNRKYADAVPVTTEFRGGRPLEVSEVLDVLASYGVPEYDGDSRDLGEAVTAPAEWKFAPETWPYVRKMLSDQLHDTPKSRHTWLIKCFVRLACAWRTSRISEEHFKLGQESIVKRMKQLCAEANPKRNLEPGEVSGAWQWAINKVSAMNDEAVFEEVGGVGSKQPATVEPAALPKQVAPEGLAELVAGNPDRFFDRERGPLVHDIAAAVLEMGPLRWGADEVFWTWDTRGVWVEAQNEVRNRCVRLLGNRYRNAIAENVKTVVTASVATLDCGPVTGFINFTNGMLDWRTGELFPHEMHYESTVQLPVAYDPDAQCPHFEGFLSEVLTEDYVRVAWQMLSYLVYSGNPLQVAFMFLGTGGNGKGTLLRVISAMLGKENCSAESLHALNTNRFAALSLFGKIANLAGDIDAKYQEETANFKKLTGEDLYAAERKFGARFMFTSWAVPVFSANKIPPSADTSRGYLRRWVILNFNRTITKPTLGLSDRLLDELPGIAAKAVAGLRPLLESEKFDITGEALEGQEEFAANIDQVREWLSECCIPAPGYKNVQNRQKTYAAYQQWALRDGRKSVTGKEFYARMDAAGYPTVKRNSGGRYIDGVKVIDGAIQEAAGQFSEIVDHMDMGE